VRPERKFGKEGKLFDHTSDAVSFDEIELD
jgi:hypothetical protein